jgi:hypothetical protein
MRVTIIEGSPEELADYEKRTGLVRQAQADVGPPLSNGKPMPAGEPQARNETSLDEALRSFISSRVREPMTGKRVLTYIQRVLDLGTEVVPGKSKVTRDGYRDNLLVYKAGPRTYGAAVSVKVTNGGLTLRLTREDVADITDSRIQFRAVQPADQYQINCPLRTDDAIDLAVDLTQRALDKIQGLESQ